LCGEDPASPDRVAGLADLFRPVELG